MEHIPGPDFPTGGIICGKTAIWKGYETGRSTIVVRSKTTIEQRKGDRYRIIVNDIPYQQTRDPVIKKISDVANEGRISGHFRRARRERSQRAGADRHRPARRTPIRTSCSISSTSSRRCKIRFSIILLALVDGKPRTLSLKEMLQEFIRHRFTVIRRRTQFLLSRARRRKHTVQGLLLAHANIDEVIRVIRASKTQAEAKEALDCDQNAGRHAPNARWAMWASASIQDERGVADDYSLTPVQAEAILKMTLGQLVNLEQEKLVDEHTKLLEQIGELPEHPRRRIANLHHDSRGLRRAEPASTPTIAAPSSAARKSATSISKT